jgi:hypothetical protein
MFGSLATNCCTVASGTRLSDDKPLEAKTIAARIPLSPNRENPLNTSNLFNVLSIDAVLVFNSRSLGADSTGQCNINSLSIQREMLKIKLTMRE